MIITKHGDADIIEANIIPFTCTRCGCEFKATRAEANVTTKEKDIGTLFAAILEQESVDLIYKINCPECGEELTKDAPKADEVKED